MGHAGAIIGGRSDTAAAKIAVMKECGIHVASPPGILEKQSGRSLQGERSRSEKERRRKEGGTGERGMG
jgi:succinyl-CoA synthetase alpha subunit